MSERGERADHFVPLQTPACPPVRDHQGAACFPGVVFHEIAPLAEIVAVTVPFVIVQ